MKILNIFNALTSEKDFKESPFRKTRAPFFSSHYFHTKLSCQKPQIKWGVKK